MDMTLPLNVLAYQGNDDSPPNPDLLPGTKATPVFDTYWKFAGARQEIFFRRLAGKRQPWTNDAILSAYKFTNVYRATDRVSQFLIRQVIGKGDRRAEELFFRIILFKLFNRIETWEFLVERFEGVTWSEYSYERYDRALSEALEKNVRIYSAAYIMPTGGKSDRKHRHHLHLLETMMKDDVPKKLQEIRTMKEAFELLRSYPSVGDFLAYQFVTDLNYSDLVDFSEMEYVKAGPGARDGIRKCFSDLGGYSPEDIIRWVVDTQRDQFDRLGIEFRNLWGRELQLIDCQNLFCEVDKYSRAAHPEITGISGRTRIKQRFQPSTSQTEMAFPVKWGIDKNMLQFGVTWEGEYSGG